MYDVVQRTTDYSIFNFMLGNRKVSEIRIRKIKKSIETNGYIFSPITCNEKMEIVDGQGRVEALKRLALPVDYIVHPGLTVKDCTVMNQYQTKWATEDYVESYAQLGNKNYENLQKLLEEFRHLPLRVCVTACTDYVGMDTKSLPDGTFVCSDETYELAKRALTYADRFTSVLKKTRKGVVSYMYVAIIFVYKNIPSVDTEKMLENFCKYFDSDIAKPFVNVLGALKSLNETYNYRAREREYFAEAYDKHCQKMNASYYKRWRNQR